MANETLNQVAIINKELESDAEFDLTIENLMNHLVLKDKDLKDIKKELLECRSNYRHYWELLYSLKLNDDVLEIVRALFAKIYDYLIMNVLIMKEEDNAAILSAANSLSNYKEMLKEIYNNAGISKTDLALSLNMKEKDFETTLTALRNYGLVTYTYRCPGDEYYYATSRGINYHKKVFNTSK